MLLQEQRQEGSEDRGEAHGNLGYGKCSLCQAGEHAAPDGLHHVFELLSVVALTVKPF